VGDRRAIETFEADHHQPPFARFVRDPGLVVLMRDARPDGLNLQAQRLVRDRREAFDTQHVELLRQCGDARGERGRVGNFLQRHHEGIEVFVVMLFLVVVVRAAIGDVVLGADTEPEQKRLVDLAVGGGDHLDAARQRIGNRGLRLGETGLVDEIALVEHDQIGAGDLVLEHFLDRIVMRQRGVGYSLLDQRVQIVRDAAVSERGAIDHDHDAVDRDAVFDRRPMKRLHQRLGQGEAGGLDDDVLDAVARQNGIERRHELVGDRAAQTAIGELDDVFFRAGGVAAAFENFAVDADIAEFVDDYSEPPALCIGNDMPNERRLAGAEKAGDDGAGNARERAVHSSIS
jgi:hypothetical protein